MTNTARTNNGMCADKCGAQLRRLGLRASPKAVLAGVFFAASVGAFGVAHAKEASDKQADDIIVSAKREGVSVQTYSAAITSIDSAAIEQKGVTNTKDLQTLVPSVISGEELGIPKVFIRGLGQNGTTIGQDPAVVTYVDGVVLGRAMSAYSTQIDLRAVEVLRGPQGTLFGRNAVGGTINYVSNRPRSDFEGELAVGYGNYNDQKIRGMVNVPVSDVLAIRAAGSYENRDGFVKNMSGGKNLEDFEAAAGRLSALYTPTDTFSAYLSIDGSTENSNGPAFLTLDAPLFPTICCGATEGVNYVIAGNKRVTMLNAPGEQPNYTERRSYGANLTLEWDLANDFKLKSISGARGFRHNQAQDSDGTNIAFVGANNVQLRANQLSQELNLEGSVGLVDGVIGGYYFQERAKEANVVPFYQGVPPGFTPFTLLANTAQKTKSFAAFADTTINITDKFRVLAGARYTRDEKNSEQTFLTAIPAFGLLVDMCAGGSPDSFKDHWSRLTWKGGLEYSLGDQGLLYATVTKGFRSGGFGDFGVCGDTFSPENVKNYEAGLKYTWLDGRVRTNLAGFRMDYANLQVQRTIVTGTVTDNAGSARIYGVELEANAKLTDELSVDVSGSWMDSEYRDYVTVYSLDFAQATLQLAGLPLNRTPKFSGTVGLNWNHDFADVGSIDARVETYFTTSYSFNPVGRMFSDFDVQDKYAIGNAYLTYTTPSGRYKVNGYVKNITNEFYLNSVLDLGSTFNHSGFAAPPRTYGVEFVTTF